MTRVLVAVLLVGCAHQAAVRSPVPPSKRVRLGSVMWPTDKAIIFCTRRVDDGGQSIGVAGPCARLEAGETDWTRVVSWATLGRFDQSPPDSAPPKLGGRCHFEIEDATLQPAEHPARLTWVTPTKKEIIETWTPGTEKEAVGADSFTVEATIAPENEWMAILRVAVSLGEGERIVQIASARLLRVPACE